MPHDIKELARVISDAWIRTIEPHIGEEALAKRHTYHPMNWEAAARAAVLYCAPRSLVEEEPKPKPPVDILKINAAISGWRAD